MKPANKGYSLLISILLCTVGPAHAAEIMPKKLSIDLLNLPRKLSPRILGSASDFIITAQCVRTLIRINELGQLSGDLAESWTVSPDHRTFRLRIRDGYKFSNGDQIRIDDVVDSLSHPDFRKISIHFDFSTIESIKKQGDQVVIELKEPNFNFIYHLTQPEFGVFHKTDRGNVLPTLEVSSGPYYIASASEKTFTLQRNLNALEQGPTELNFFAMGDRKFKALQEGKLDIALLWEDPSSEYLDSLVKSQKFDIMKPHVGFTYWLTLNADSKIFQDSQFRSVFQIKTKSAFSKRFVPTSSWSSANQLFLPGGPGRINENWAENFWNRAAAKPKHPKKTLRGLVSRNFQFSKELEESLKEVSESLGLDLQLTEYIDQAHFLTLLKENGWDFYFINNDFSSYELIQNLIVTFNKDKPLIRLPQADQETQALWKKIKNSAVAEERYANIELLARLLLEKSLIVPLVYKNVPIVKRNNIDLSRWSNLFPEFAFWKVRIEK